MSSPSKVLLTECRDIARKRLTEVIAAALKKIDEDLFVLADKTKRREEQQVYLDAMGKVREHRAAIEHRFEECFADLFEKRLYPMQNQPTLNSWGGVELCLVSHSKIEGSIEIDRLAKGITKGADDDEQLGIRARFGHLLARDSLEDAENPLSAELIFEALNLACHQIPAGSVKQAVLTAFQPYLRDSINSVYHAVNANLVAHRILPQIRHNVKVTSDPLGVSGRNAVLAQSQRMPTLDPVPGNGQRSAEQEAVGTAGRSGWLGGTAGAPAAGAAGIQQQSLGYLLTGLAQGLAGARAEAVGLFVDPQRFPAGPGAVPASASLLDSLSTLQFPLEPAGFPAAAGAHAVRQIDRALIAQGTPLDQLTLELVSVVFDFLVANATLPEPVKGAISRLQIVAIKAALLDRSFFARREHPMRRLLDRMAEAGTDPLVDCRDDGPFMQGLRSLADALCIDFRDDCAVFDHALSGLEQLVQDQHDRCQAASASSTQALAGSEAESSAREAARADIALRLGETTPVFIREFLTRWWADAVAIAELTGGGDDNNVTVRLRLASDLAWSVDPKSRADVVTLATMLPVLVRGLMRGTLDVGMPETEREMFFNQLMGAHTDAIAAAKRAAPDVQTAPRPAPAEAQRRAPEPETVPADQYERQVASLAKGDMLELSDERANERFRLGWVSPKKTFYAFMGGGRLRQLSASQLAAFFRQGVATLAPADVPVVDQAIESMSLDFCAMPVAA